MIKLIYLYVIFCKFLNYILALTFIGKSKPNRKVNLDEIDFRRINPDRNLKNVENKFMKLSKKERVERLIQAEQYIADNNKIWVANHFEMFK